jgi:hypothetical protein
MLVNFKPLALGLVGRILDIITTEIALMNPLYYEAFPIYQSYIFKLIMALVCLLPQLALYEFPEYSRLAIWGSYFVALIMFLPVINNLLLLMI